MAKRGKIERKIDRCWYWTRLTYAECVDRHLDRTGNPVGSTATGLQKSVKTSSSTTVEKEAATAVLTFLFFLAAIGGIAWIVSKIPAHLDNE